MGRRPCGVFLLLCAATCGGATCGPAASFAGFLAADLTHVCQRLPSAAARCTLECRPLRSCADWPGSYVRAFRPRRSVAKPVLCCKGPGVRVDERACRRADPSLGQVAGKGEVFADIRARISRAPKWRQRGTKRPPYVLKFGRKAAAVSASGGTAAVGARTHAAACAKCMATAPPLRPAHCARLLPRCYRKRGKKAARRQKGAGGPADIVVLGYEVCAYTPGACAEPERRREHSAPPGARCGALSAAHYPRHVLKRVRGETRVRRRASRRIVGGREAVPHSYPWQVSLNDRRERGGGPECGGALVARRWALTAAHCVYVNGTTLKEAGALEVNLGRHYAATGGRHAGVAKVLPHPRYVDSYSDYDIALLRLDKAIVYTDEIRPICLPAAGDGYGRRVGTKAIVTGWGFEHNSRGREVRAAALKEVVVPVADPARCRNVHVGGIYVERELCAGGEAGSDSCGGDSGGPLHVLRAGRLVLAGLVARGHQVCGTAGYPAVYTDVAALVPWIESIMRT